MVFVHFVQCLMFLLIIYLLILYTVPPIEKCATIFKLHTFSVVFFCRKHSSSVAAYRTFEMIFSLFFITFRVSISGIFGYRVSQVLRIVLVTDAS